MKKNKRFGKHQIKATLTEIGDFVRFCKRDSELAGFNVVISKQPGKSYIIGKTNESLKPKYILPIPLDYANPIERPLIANAIHEALYQQSMTPEAMEEEMVSKSKD